MEFRTLRAFVEVVRQGSFSQAARTIFATQSTVSKAVKQLEDELGAPLFDRIGPRVKLTTFGEALYPRAARLLAERSDLLVELDEIRGLQRGSLRIGLPPVGSARIFAPMLARYRRTYPGIAIELREHGGDQLLDMVRTGEIELAATVDPSAPEWHSQEVWRDPVMAVMARDHPLAKAGSLSLDALRDEPFILFSDSFVLHRMVVDACHRHGFKPNIAVQSSEVEFILELAASGIGIAFLPRLLVDQLDAERICGVLVTEPYIEWRLAMVWRNGAFLSHAARAWLQMVADQAD